MPQNSGLQENLDKWLGKLNEKQREVVERRFGLHGYENSTLEQVANELGVTRERVRQIQMDALRRLPAPATPFDLVLEIFDLSILSVHILYFFVLIICIHFK